MNRLWNAPRYAPQRAGPFRYKANQSSQSSGSQQSKALISRDQRHWNRQTNTNAGWGGRSSGSQQTGHIPTTRGSSGSQWWPEYGYVYPVQCSQNRLRVRMHGTMHTRPPTGETAAAAKHAHTQPPHQRLSSRCSSVRHSHERRNKKMTSTNNDPMYAYMWCKFLPSPWVLRVCPPRDRLRVRKNGTPLLAWAKSFTNEGTLLF